MAAWRARHSSSGTHPVGIGDRGDQECSEGHKRKFEAQVTAQATDRQLQVVSMHLPSCLRTTYEEYEQYDFFT